MPWPDSFRKSQRKKAKVSPNGLKQLSLRSTGTIDADQGQGEEPRFKSVADAVASYTLDSRAQKPDPKYRSAFGDLVEEKMAKQGFKRPEWPR